jgi:hypothetical protein
MARTKLVALPDRESVSVRFDNPTATLVEEERVLTLQQGETLVDFSWRGVSIDPDSIRIELLSHPGKVTLLSVAYPPGEAALVWRLSSKEAWEERVRISYLLSGIDRMLAWRGQADKDERTLAIDGYLVLRNFSGEDFDRARVTLGQGDAFTAGSRHEETRQVKVFSAARVPIRKTFTWDAATLPWEPKRLDTNVGIPVHYVVANGKESNLGQGILWEGKFRVFQDDGKEGSIFLGEDQVKTTHPGEEMRIYIGDSREIAVTQKKVRDVSTNPRPSKYKVVIHDTDEAIETEVENFKDREAMIDLIQHIPGEWKIDSSSLPFEKKDANTIVFHVTVPAGGKRKLDFSYRRLNVRP